MPTPTPCRILVVAAALVSGCAGGARRGDDLGYDPAISSLDAAVEPLFSAPGLPMARSGVPLRGAAVEGEWRTFRGNTERSGTRLVRGIVAPTILWSADVGIQGYANSPLVGTDAVFVTSQGDTHDAADAADGFYALDGRDGSRLWFHPTGEDINGASLSDELVIGGADDGTLYAVERATGALRWSTELDDPIHHGPLVVGDDLFVQGADGVRVLDVATGRLEYILPGSDDGWDVRGALAADDKRLFRTAAVCRLDAFDGDDPAWAATACSPSTDEWVGRSNYTPPAVVGTAVLTVAPAAMDYSWASLEMSLRDGETGERFWGVETERLVAAAGMTDARAAYDLHYHASMPWLMNGTAFLPMVTAGYLVGFDLRTGELEIATDLGGCRCRQFPSIVGVPSRGYLARHEGHLHGFSPADGSITWTLDLQYEQAAGPVSSAGGALAFMFDDDYCSADPWDGSALFATPAIGPDGTLYVGSGEGILYAIGDATW